MLEQLVVKLLEAMTVPLGAALAYFVIRLVQGVAAKLHLQVSEQTDAQIRYYAAQAVKAAEEYAAKRLKMSGVVMSGDEKLEAALASVVAKIPGVDKVVAQDAIHAALTDLSLGAASKPVPAPKG